MTEIIFVLIVVILLLGALFFELVTPVLGFIGVIVVFLLSGVLTPSEALSGIANEQLAVIILLLIISDSLKKTRFLNDLFDRFLGEKESEKGFLFKMTGSVGLSSAFLNNTPLVAMSLGYVNEWCKAKNISPSKMLIPLSYASILGGCMTLVGTSTNLIVNGMAVNLGQESLGIFDFAIVGGVMLVIGLIYLMTIGYKILPDKKSPDDELLHGERKFFLEAHVQNGSGIIGKEVGDVGLRKLKGLFLVEILRGEKIIRPVSPNEIVEEADLMIFAGNPKNISDLSKPELGLSLPKVCDFPINQETDIAEVVVSANSRLVGKKVQDSNFRGRYDGAILAVHRNGEKIEGKIGEIILKAGDVLLVLAGTDFYIRIKNNPAFYVLSKKRAAGEVSSWKSMFLWGGLIISIILAFFGVPLFNSLITVVLLGVLINAIVASEIRNGVDFNLILIIAAGISIGTAIQKSGAAEFLASEILVLFNGSSGVVLLGIIFIITNGLAAFMTSKAAVAVTLPIALQLAGQLGLDPKPFILVVAFGGAANFITPIGFQTNLMVFGPGNYSFKDFFKIGFPLTIVYLLVCVTILGYLYNL